MSCTCVPWAWRDPAERPAERGDCLGAFCVVELNDGAVHRERMSVAEIESIRARSKAGKSGPWVTDWDEMARKTVFRRASKWIPLSADIADALLKDGDTITIGPDQAPRLEPPQAKGMLEHVMETFDAKPVEASEASAGASE